MRPDNLNSKSMGKKEIQNEILIVDQPRAKLASQIKIKNATNTSNLIQQDLLLSESKENSHKSRIGID